MISWRGDVITKSHANMGSRFLFNALPLSWALQSKDATELFGSVVAFSEAYKHTESLQHVPWYTERNFTKYRRDTRHSSSTCIGREILPRCLPALGKHIWMCLFPPARMTERVGELDVSRGFSDVKNLVRNQWKLFSSLFSRDSAVQLCTRFGLRSCTLC